MEDSKYEYYQSVSRKKRRFSTLELALLEQLEEQIMFTEGCNEKILELENRIKELEELV